MKDLFRLFALTTIMKDQYGFLTAGTLSREQLNEIPSEVLILMGRIRPHCVSLVDAWAIPDYLLDRYFIPCHERDHDWRNKANHHSALGRADGMVYEDMFNRAHRLNPLNSITFNADYHTEEIVHGSGDGGHILSKL